MENYSSEKDLVNLIINFVNNHKNCYIHKVQQGAYSKKGTSDTIGLVHGYFLAIEFKKYEGAKITKNQLDYLEKIYYNKGYACIVNWDNYEEFMEIFHKIIEAIITNNTLEKNNLRDFLFNL